LWVVRLRRKAAYHQRLTKLTKGRFELANAFRDKLPLPS
jgi:hypothetical protein